MMFLASTLGTSSGDGTSQYGTDVGTAAASTIATTGVSLSDGTDAGKQGTRSFYDCHASGAPKNRVFVDMLRKFKPRDKVKEPRPIKSKPQGGTAQNKLKELWQKLKRCKMGRKAWIKLILVATVLCPVLASVVQASAMALGVTAEPVVGVIAMYGSPMLFALIYGCVLLCFWCSKKGKCIVNRICTDETRTETEKNEGEVNKNPEAPNEAGESEKQGGPERQEARGKLKVPWKLKLPKKP
ncbi:hypothetical protein AK88_02174 [Plasmodium fragile]|uniref:Uncharacterized protein n=1 Tax=Plasmodium fragile TaxID=5857 RepID=A0A0D9QN69_PLAFR|nr:uncharacterized protein AK88_02174 [Plasmodium fragile]KJP88227.1 hypothetical protein AK88_02174 [Plasmodium fragile]